jgi:hypothetical protein
MALGSTRPLTELSTRNLPGGKGRLVRKTENLNAICELIVYKMWEPRRLTTLWASAVCYMDSVTFFFTFYSVDLRHKYRSEVDVSDLISVAPGFIRPS